MRANVVTALFAAALGSALTALLLRAWVPVVRAQEVEHIVARSVTIVDEEGVERIFIGRVFPYDAPFIALRDKSGATRLTLSVGGAPCYENCDSPAVRPVPRVTLLDENGIKRAELSLAWEELQQALYPELDFFTPGGRRYSCQAPQAVPGVIPVMPVPCGSVFVPH